MNWELYKLFCYRKGLIEGRLRSFIEFAEWLGGQGIEK